MNKPFKEDSINVQKQTPNTPTNPFGNGELLHMLSLKSHPFDASKGYGYVCKYVYPPKV